MDVTVIICSCNRCDSLAKVLQGLEVQEIPQGTAWEVLIVDNNSTDGTRDVVESYIKKCPGMFKYRFEERQGKSFALNTAITESKSRILAFTDDDVHVDPNWLSGLLSTFAQFDCVGVGGRIVPEWTHDKPAWLQLRGPYRLMAAIVRFDFGLEPCEIDTPPFGANMAFKTEMFAKYGLFRTDLGPTVGNQMRGEDTEFCRRLIAAGESLIYAPNAVVYHPVEKPRTEKSFFLSWYFDYGRALIRNNGIDKNVVSCFGVPIYHVRSLLVSLFHWAFALNSPRRFYYKLNSYLLVGQIAEWFRISRRVKLAAETLKD